jgi:hypothetical protein
LAQYGQAHRDKIEEFSFKDLMKTILENPANADKQTIIEEAKITENNLNVLLQNKDIVESTQIEEEKVNAPEKQEEAAPTTKQLDPLVKDAKLFLVAGTIVKVWDKQGVPKEMHLYMTYDLDEIQSKKPFSTQPEKEFCLKIEDVAGVVKGYEKYGPGATSPFAKPKGLFKKSKSS